LHRLRCTGPAATARASKASHGRATASGVRRPASRASPSARQFPVTESSVTLPPDRGCAKSESRSILSSQKCSRTHTMIISSDSTDSNERGWRPANLKARSHPCHDEPQHGRCLPALSRMLAKQRRPQLLLSTAKLRPSLCSHRSKRAGRPTIWMTTLQSMRFQDRAR
jgi:hypothetical protein